MTSHDPTDFLTLDDLLEVANGVLPEVGIRDMGLLESACARPQTTVFGDLAYPGLCEQAAALFHSLARNHALVDGNKLTVEFDKAGRKMVLENFVQAV